MYDDGMAVAEIFVGLDGCGAERERVIGEEAGWKWYVFPSSSTFTSTSFYGRITEPDF